MKKSKQFHTYTSNDHFEIFDIFSIKDIASIRNCMESSMELFKFFHQKTNLTKTNQIV